MLLRKTDTSRFLAAGSAERRRFGYILQARGMAANSLADLDDAEREQADWHLLDESGEPNLRKD
jgi:hypothetical protein